MPVSAVLLLRLQLRTLTGQVLLLRVQLSVLNKAIVLHETAYLGLLESSESSLADQAQHSAAEC